MNRFLVVLFLLLPAIALFADKKEPVGEPYAWRLTQPLGTPYQVPLDTLIDNYYHTDLPLMNSTAYSYTGNLGGPGISKIFFDRPDMPQFIFKAPYDYLITTPSNYTYYNTRLPMTLLSYLFGGNKLKKQEDLNAEFSGNINRRIAVAANLRYILSRGSYDHQATKDMTWQIAGSYIGDKYQLHLMANTYNFVNQENGGIADDRFILEPDEMESGQGGFDSQTIPVHLYDAYNRLRGHNYYLTHRYNLGFYKTEMLNDTTEKKIFTPVTSFIHTIEYNNNMRRFVNQSAKDDTTFFENTYFRKDGSNDSTEYWSLKNTIGISLLEGFNKYAKMGMSAYLSHEFRRYTLMSDVIPQSMMAAPTIPMLPNSSFTHIVEKAPRVFNENVLWVGAILSKKQGELLTYSADASLGLVGVDAGAVKIDGEIQTRFKIRKTTVQLRAYGFFKNEAPSFYYRRYTSNHFIWNNNYGKIRKFRVGGEFRLPVSGTFLNIGVENVQNYVYFGNNALPVQDDRILQIFSATLRQKVKWGIFNLNLEAIYQKTSDSKVIPLPDLSAYAQMYLDFKIAKVLQIQAGVDCKYHTSYYAEVYQPATLSFHTQDKMKVGNYPLMNVYANMKMKMVRFYIMYTHFNQGLFGGNNYYLMPGYPHNPATLQFGLCVNFTN